MLKEIFRKNRKFMLLSVATSLIASLATLAIPFLSNRLFAQVADIQLINVLLVVGVMLGSYFFQVLLILLRENAAVNVNEKNLRQFLDKLFHVEYDTMIATGNNNLIDKVAALTNSIYQFMLNDVIQLVSAVVIITGSLFWLYRENLFYGLAVSCLIPTTFFGYKLLNKELGRRSKKLQAVTSKNFQDIMSIYEQPDFVKQQVHFSGIEHLMAQRIQEIYQAHAEINRFAGTSSQIINFLNTFVENAILLLISYQVAIGKTQVGSLVVFTLVISIFFDAVYSLNHLNLNYTRLKVNTAFYQEEISGNLETTTGTPVTTIEKLAFKAPTVTVGDTKFSYPLTAQFTPGDVVYLAGKSGAGKSTLVRALLNVRPVTGITINELPLNQLDKGTLRGRIAYVPQSASLIPGTLRENILVDTQQSPEVDAKIQQLNILQPLWQNKSLDTLILRNGENLSGGEKQRVAIARALLQEADVYIFDEVTSNLDGTSQEIFFSEFIASLEKKIVFIISHDEGVAQYANRRLTF